MRLCIPFNLCIAMITIEKERVSRCENWIQQLKDWSSKLTVLFVPLQLLRNIIIAVVLCFYFDVHERNSSLYCCSYRLTVIYYDFYGFVSIDFVVIAIDLYL